MRAVGVYEYCWIGYRRTWKGSILNSFVLPVLFMLSIGLGVGGYVDAAGGVGGVDYLSYLAPGLLASNVAQLAVSASMFPVFAGFAWSSTYFAMMTTPLRVGDILLGELGFLVTRVLVSACAFIAVMAVFGAIRSPGLLLAPPVAALLGLALGAPTYAYSAWTRSATTFSLLHRLFVIPLSLFSGVFFPVGQLPGWLRPVAWVSPLWHAVELVRPASLGVLTAAAWWHLAYLVGWAAAGCALAYVAFRRRLERS